LIPHLPIINPDNQLVGVDTRQYAIWMDELRASKNSFDFLNKAFVEILGGDRPLSLFFLFAFQNVVDSSGQTDAHNLEYVTFILAPSLVIVSYFLTRELTRNDNTSLLAAFLTSISFHILIGIYAGFYANWLALIA